jgi:hypothetical protein
MIVAARCQGAEFGGRRRSRRRAEPDRSQEVRGCDPARFRAKCRRPPPRPDGVQCPAEVHPPHVRLERVDADGPRRRSWRGPIVSGRRDEKSQGVAADTYTHLGGSVMPDEVGQAMVDAGQHYVPIRDMEKAVGEKIARFTGNEGALVTTGAAGSIFVGTCACIAGADFVSGAPPRFESTTARRSLTC